MPSDDPELFSAEQLADCKRKLPPFEPLYIVISRYSGRWILLPELFSDYEDALTAAIKLPRGHSWSKVFRLAEPTPMPHELDLLLRRALDDSQPESSITKAKERHAR